ncbi:MAG: hypothetical protein SP1CHLAM54_11980 [Chlamydiia bacterium]|nr:hypothetical protein [Chlamydiia bacterium]MCH9616097.1 hypothetical protein [Chlamydiia bacterium]MCH9629480.1 hypothetical protein [Chlamydiia bacterium]
MYRPQKFIEVLGQEAIVQTLKNAIKLKRIGNAYLFCGMRGTGKTTLARLFAKAINCENLENGEPCNTCQSCKEITSGSSLDVIEIDGASNRGIEDIRQINDNVGYASWSGQCKITIIDEVHMLTKEAFNALLKTLEEPPANTKFFFATTEPHKVLPTITSRCQRFDLKRIPDELIIQKLKSIANQVPNDALALIAKRSEGSLRDAESILDQMVCSSEEITPELVCKNLGIPPAEVFDKLEKAMLTHDVEFAKALADELFSSGGDLANFVEELASHFLTHISNKNSPFKKAQIFSILDYLNPWLADIRKTPFKRANVEIILLKLIRLCQTSSLEDLIERLIDLESKIDQPAKVQEVKENPIPPAAPVQAQEPEPIPIPIPSSPPRPPNIHHDRLMQFAAVELSGTVKKS